MVLCTRSSVCVCSPLFDVQVNSVMTMMTLVSDQLVKIDPVINHISIDSSS